MDEPVTAFEMYKKKIQKYKRNLILNEVSPNKKKKTTEHSSEPRVSRSLSTKRAQAVNGNSKKTKKEPTLPKANPKGNKKPLKETAIQTKIQAAKLRKKAKLQNKKQIKINGKQPVIVDDEDEIPTLVPIVQPLVVNETIETNDFANDGLKLFKWLISPINSAKFLKDFWETEVLYVERSKPDYYEHILSTAILDDILRNNILYYTRNIDVVSYNKGVKEVFNQEGRAHAAALWDYYSNGCSIRLLNPQTYNNKIHLLIATLQEYFGTMVGTNAYLTPPGSQGFAPHYDDIEAFVVQLEGRKHWKLYKPKDSDVLARDSSPNFSHEEIGKPFLEVTLNAGDLLYFPRGTIHEGFTDSDAHSLHITLSVYQHTAYADLFEHLLPAALKKAAQNEVEFREGLPINYLKHVGCVNKGLKGSLTERAKMQTKLQGLMKTLGKYLDVDAAADQLGKKFMHDAMPPVLSRVEFMTTCRGDGDYIKNGKVYNRVEIGLDTKVRLLRYHCIRIVEDESTTKIYYCTDNARVYHGEEAQWLEVDKGLLEVVAKLQSSFPAYVEVEQLPGGDELAKMQLVSDLWERGLLVTSESLPCIDDEGTSDDGESDLSDDIVQLD